MSQLRGLKRLKRKMDNNLCTISDLKRVYKHINTRSEVIVARKGDIQHLYYRDYENKTVILEQELVPYEDKISTVWQHDTYPLDLCTTTFYDEVTNRYGQGIILPRKKKFVMVDNMDLVEEPNASSFYTIGIKEDNQLCGSIVDREGNLYRMYGYEENDKRFGLSRLEVFTFPSCLYQEYGVLVHYNNKPVYAEIKKSPYMIMDKETFQKQGNGIKGIRSYLDEFDNKFMQGKRYVKK